MSIPENIYLRAKQCADDAVTEAIARAVMEERERCVRVFESGLGRTFNTIAQRIRTGGEPWKAE